MLLTGRCIEERGGEFLRTFARPVRCIQQQVGEGLQSLLSCDLCARTTFGLVGQVQVLQFLLAGRCANRSLQLLGQVALIRDALEDGVATDLELEEVGTAFGDSLQRLVVQPAGGLLAVPRYERDGAAIGEQARGSANLHRTGARLSGDELDERIL